MGKEKQANAEKMKADQARGKAVQAQKKAAAGAPPPEREPDTRSDQLPMLNQQYQKTIVPALMKEFDYANVMEVPKVVKVIVNIGIGEAKDNDKALEAGRNDVKTITGQAPVVIKSRKSVAAFKLRAGMPVGIRTTLRGRRMYYFLEKLINVALPRIRDFRGISPEAFDGRGNYTLGLREPDHLSRDRLRQDRQAPRSRDHRRDHREDRRRRSEPAHPDGHAVPQARAIGEAIWRRSQQSNPGRRRRSTRPGSTTGAGSAAARVATCGSSACAGSASATLPPRDASPA